MRAWRTAAIEFGCVTIPVKVYAATERKGEVTFNLLHQLCHARLEQQYVCAAEAIVVPPEAQVRGYEHEKGKYVVFTDDEIAELKHEIDLKAIDIDCFVKLEDVDTLYFDKCYFLGPDRGGDKSYKLLARGLAKTKRVAVARWGAHLVLVVSVDDHLVLQQLHYADEVRSLDDVPADEAATSPADLRLMTQAIRQLERAKFEPAHYRNEARARLHERIQAKIEGRQVVSPPQTDDGGKIIDIADALKASLAGKGRKNRGTSSSSSSSG